MDEVRGSSPLRSTRVPLVGTSIYLDNCTIDCCKIRVVPRNNLSSLTDERFFVGRWMLFRICRRRLHMRNNIHLPTGKRERQLNMITKTKYNPKEIEEKWQHQWETERLYHAPD